MKRIVFLAALTIALGVGALLPTATAKESGATPPLRQGDTIEVLNQKADVAKVFPNAAAVNDSLRALAGIIRRQRKRLAGK